MGEGDLDYSGDESLTALPAGLERVEGDLILKGCVNLTELPESLTFVGGDLDLRSCTRLTSLAKMTIAGDLRLGPIVNFPNKFTLDPLPPNCCSALTSLPVGLEVKGNCDLFGCTGLTNLPSGLVLGGNLNLSGCENLTALSCDSKFGGLKWKLKTGGVFKAF
jgi:hypothetical protein